MRKKLTITRRIFIPFALDLAHAALAETARIAVIASSGSTFESGLWIEISYIGFEVRARDRIQTWFTTCVLIELVRCGRVPPDIVDPSAIASKLTDNFRNRSRHLLGNEPINEYTARLFLMATR